MNWPAIEGYGGLTCDDIANDGMHKVSRHNKLHHEHKTHAWFDRTKSASIHSYDNLVTFKSLCNIHQIHLPNYVYSFIIAGICPITTKLKNTPQNTSVTALPPPSSDDHGGIVIFVLFMLLFSLSIKKLKISNVYILYYAFCQYCVTCNGYKVLQGHTMSQIITLSQLLWMDYITASTSSYFKTNSTHDFQHKQIKCTPNQPCTIICDEGYGCAGSTIFCPEDATCDVQCVAGHACNGVCVCIFCSRVLDGNKSIYVTSLYLENNNLAISPRVWHVEL